MKKIFIGFLSVLTIYHFLYSSMFSVYASDLENTTIEDIEMPVVHNMVESYSATLTLGSMAFGSATVLTAPVGLGAFLVGAAVFGIGAYFILQGHSSISLEDYYKEMPTNITSSDIEVKESGAIEVKPSDKNKVTYFNNATSSFYPRKYQTPTSSSTVTSGTKILYNDMLGVNATALDSSYVGLTFSAPGKKVVVPVYTSTYLNKFRGYMVFEGDNSMAFRFSGNDFINWSNYTCLSSAGAEINCSSSGFGGRNYVSGSPSYTTNNGNRLYSVKEMFTTAGILTLSSSEYDTFREALFQSTLVSSKPYSIPLEQLAYANPTLTYDMELGKWFNAEGEEVDPKDMVMPLPNNLTHQGLSFDKTTQAEIDKVLNGESDVPSGDVDSGVGGTGWLSSVLNAIMSLPSLIANAFASLFEMVVNAIKSIPNAIGLFIDNVIIAVQSIPNALSGMFDNVVGAVQSIPNALSGVLGGISTGINNTWEWCKGLPNVLGELLGALGSAIVDGLTLAFSGVISGIQTIVDFFVGILDFIMSLVIPSDGFFSSELSKLGDVFNSKFPFFSQIGDILNAFKFDINAPLPEFKITVPIKFGGGTYNVINFAHFVSYRQYILNFIRLFTWIPFLMRIYKKSMYMATGK